MRDECEETKVGHCELGCCGHGGPSSEATSAVKARQKKERRVHDMGSLSASTRELAPDEMIRVGHCPAVRDLTIQQPATHHHRKLVEHPAPAIGPTKSPQQLTSPLEEHSMVF